MEVKFIDKIVSFCKENDIKNISVEIGFDKYNDIKKFKTITGLFVRDVNRELPKDSITMIYKGVVISFLKSPN